MSGAYFTYWWFALTGWSPYLSVPVSIALLFALGLVRQRRLIHRVVEAPELSSLLLTFGISIALVKLCERVFVLDCGQKIAEGPPEELQRDARVIEAYLGR